MKFNQQVDKQSILILLGCFCNNPRLFNDERYVTTEYDFPENFHKLIWGAIKNLVKKGNLEEITPMLLNSEMSQFDVAYNIWNMNDGWQYIEVAKEQARNEYKNIGRYYDEVRKYSMIRNATEELKMNVDFLYNENNEETMKMFSSMTSNDILREINEKFTKFKRSFKGNNDDVLSFHAGDGIEERIETFKSQENVYGYPFNSAYLTTVYRGMRSKKFIIRSAPSGVGKSRSCMADALNIASSHMYDWNKHEWVFIGEPMNVLYISTELTKEEIQDCLLAHITGIAQDRLEEWKDIGEEELQVIERGIKLMQECKLYCEYTSDFTIDSINELIESHVINNNITHCFFDYINDSPSLYSYFYEKTKTRLRTDQILFMFSEQLKLTCNKYNIYLGSATQLNDTYKDDNNKDGSALKGSKAIIEKADGGILALPVTHKELAKLEPILLNMSGSFGDNTPNMSYYVFKNRGGKWKNIIIWTKLDLGTMREEDCFVTNYNFELVLDIEKTFTEFEFNNKVDNAELLDFEMNIDGSELANELSKSR